MSDEDFEPFVGGPPPDPSERTWRHPSELAAQAHDEAMAAKGRGFGRSRHGFWDGSRHRSLTLLLAGSVGAAVCLTAVAVFSVDGSDGGGLDTSAIGPTGVVEIDPLEGDDPATVPAISDTTDVAPPLSTTVPASLPASADATANPAVADTADDHLAAIVAGSEHIASGVVVGGYVLTSASAVGDRLTISVSRGAGDPVLAYLVGVDPFSDLAVYRPSVGARAATAWSAISLRALDAALDNTAFDNTAFDNTAPSTDPGDSVFLASATATGAVIDGGIVIDLDCEGETPDGQTLVGLIDTGIRRPVDGAGSLLVAADGSPVGVVVESTSSLASAVPITDALLIARRLVERGWASETWIGFIGMDVDDGVEVVDVTSDGPAAAAGLRPGDKIAFLDGSPIAHMGGVTAGLRRANPGDAMVMVVERDGEFASIRVIAGSYASAADVTAPVGG